MREHNKQQLIENLRFTTLHVAKVKELLAKYHCFHHVSFHSLTAVLVTLLLLLLFWATGLTNVIHTVADRIGASIVSIEAKAPEVEERSAQTEAEVVEGVEAKTAGEEAITAAEDTDTAGEEAAGTEDELLNNISMVADIFTSQSKYSASGVFKYALIVALFDTIFIVGLAVGMTHGIFYLYRYVQVERNKEKLKKLVLDIKEELAMLEKSFIPQEYWHVPYLQRMQRYVEQDRVDDLRGCLNLIDIEIRHKQIVEALAQEEVNSTLLAEAISPTHSVIPRRGNSSIEDGKSTNLSLK